MGCLAVSGAECLRPHTCVQHPPAPCSLTGGCTGTLKFLLVLLEVNVIHAAVINRVGALWKALFQWPRGSVSTWEICGGSLV